MKRVLSVFVAALLLSCLAGCQANPAETNTDLTITTDTGTENPVKTDTTTGFPVTTDTDTPGKTDTCTGFPVTKVVFPENSDSSHLFWDYDGD